MVLQPLGIQPNQIRASTTMLPPSDNTPSFSIGRANKSYKHQYANIYFIRLRILRDVIEQRAQKRWKNISGNPQLVPRVLEVTKSHLCYIIGTVYMDMPLKPNVMEDIARDHSIPPIPPPLKFYSPDDNVMLEDESGRVHLIGECLKGARLVTGVIIGALGMETPSGDFEVVDICYAEMAPQPSPPLELSDDAMAIDGKSSSSAELDEWIGVISGLEIGAMSPSDAQIQMLVEYLTGEAGGLDEQIAASQISRLIIAGNSLEAITIGAKSEPPSRNEDRKARRYGYDATTFSPHPILNLSAHLLDIGRVMPVHILPGEMDPSGTIMPQQPFPRNMFGEASKLSTFFCETNPTYLHLALGEASDSILESRNLPLIRRTLLINSGQPLNDIFKYLPSPPHTKLSILESTLRWRHMAPTAPDTLWCHPYFTADPFLISESPDIYIVGGQELFATKLVIDPEDANKEEILQKRCRIVTVPSFARTGTMVLVNLRTLDVKCVNCCVEGMTGGVEDFWHAEDKELSATPVAPIPSAPTSSPDSPENEV